MDNSDKEVEVAKFMCHIKKPDTDKDDGDENDNEAFEIISKNEPMDDQDETEHTDEDEHMEEVVEHEQTTKHEQVLTQVVEQNDHSDDDQNDMTGRYYRASDGQLLPVKSEMDDHENVDTVELIQCEDGDDQIAREDDEPDLIEEEVIQNNDGTETFILHNVPQQQQSKQIIINNPNEIVNYTTSGAQQAQPVLTYVDESTGVSLGSNQVQNHTQMLTVETPGSIGSSSPKKRLISTQPQNGQQKQFILPSSTINQGNQIIQIAGQNGQPNQMIIVPQGNIILLPSNNDQNGIKTLQVVPANQFQSAQHQQQQQQQIVILSTPDGNGQGQVIQQIQTDNGQQVSPTQTVGGKKQVKILDNSNSMIEHAANVARIYDQPAGQQVQANRNNQANGGQASVVSSQHHYPSPFSQVPVEERPHSCTFCYKRFARADECKRHERIHTDTRPFACTYCPRRFTRKDHLRTHTRCHTKEKPYICPLCARGFARSDERIRHVKTHVKKGEGTLEEIKQQMPKPKFEPKPKFKAVSYRPETTQITSPQNVTPTLLQNIQISPSPSAGDSGGHVTAKIIQIPISTIANGNQTIQIQSMTQD